MSAILIRKMVVPLEAQHYLVQTFKSDLQHMIAVDEQFLKNEKKNWCSNTNFKHLTSLLMNWKCIVHCTMQIYKMRSCFTRK